MKDLVGTFSDEPRFAAEAQFPFRCRVRIGPAA